MSGWIQGHGSGDGALRLMQAGQKYTGRFANPVGDHRAFLQLEIERSARFWGMSAKSMLETGESVARTRLWPEDCNRERTTS